MAGCSPWRHYLSLFGEDVPSLEFLFFLFWDVVLVHHETMSCLHIFINFKRYASKRLKKKAYFFSTRPIGNPVLVELFFYFCNVSS